MQEKDVRFATFKTIKLAFFVRMGTSWKPSMALVNNKPSKVYLQFQNLIKRGVVMKEVAALYIW